MSRTELILNELLKALEDGADPGRVLRRHGDSKSVLYSALSAVIPVAEERLQSAVAEERSARKRLDGLREEIKAAEARRNGLVEEIADTGEKLRQVLAELSSKIAPLESAEALGRMGFTPDRLKQLHEFLSGIPIARRGSKDDVVAAFFEIAAKMSRSLDLKLQEKRTEERLTCTKMELAQSRAEVERLENVAKSLREPIEALDRLRGVGVDDSDLIEWNTIIQQG